MLLTKATEYALLSITIIANSKTPRDVESLSNMLNIPKSFLAKILQALSRDGILESYKGAKGGFLIKTDLNKITIMDIINSVEKKSANVSECSKNISDCPNGIDRALHCSIWPYLNRLQNRVDSFLASITIEDILKK